MVDAALMVASVDPLVSVVLPVRNGAATLGRAIASIQRQTLTNWELVMVDDGSVDATRSVAENIARRDLRIRVLPNAEAGIVTALNTGLANARGSLIARMDADDESHPERLAEQAAFLTAESNREIGLVSSLVEFGGDRGTSAGYALHVDWINSLVTSEQIALNRFVESPFAHPSVMFRREVVERLGGYQAGDFPEDYELWLRWLDAGVRMAKVPRVLLTWHDVASRLSRTDQRYDPEAFFRLKAEWVAKAIGRLGWGEPDVNGESKPRARPVYVWGAGRPTRKRAAHLAAHGVRITGYVDVDPKKFTPAIGGVGLPVMSFTALPDPRNAFVLGYVSSRGAREFIARALRARGYESGRDFLLCA